MARINIEEKFWFDPRLRALQKKLGDAEAIGQILTFWRLAQEQFKEKKLITESQFKVAGLKEDLFECEWAIRTDNGIRCKGDKRNFGWLLERKEAGRNGGIKSGKSRKLSKIETKQNQIVSVSKTKQNEPSTSTSTSYSLKKEEKKELKAQTETSDAAKFIGILVTSYQKRYGQKTRPELGPKVQGQIKNFIKGRSFEEASTLIQVYFQMNDQWFIKKCHDFSTFLENLQKVKLSFETGKEAGIKRSRGIKEILEDEKNSGELVP